MRNTSLALLAGLALMACTPASEPADTATPPADSSATLDPAATPAPPLDPAATDACGAAQYASLVGKPATDPDVPPEGPNVRHIRPDSQVTMDFRPDRLNVHIDAAGVITEFRCT